MSIHAAIATNRFGLGARPGDIETVAGDPKAWLRGQLTENAAEGFPASGLVSAREHIRDFYDYRLTGSARNQSGSEPQVDPEAAARYLSDARRTIVQEIQARTLYGESTDTPLHERLTRFWSNHFTVSARKFQTTPLAGAYEREAIRPNILGTFEDLAEAAIFHPAMLIYLDNWQSVGPSTRPAERRGLGLNENLAREVMELHTVTPASGYTQEDVTEFAKALTGWSVGNPRFGQMRKGETLFAGAIHESGARTVLGKRYTQSGGQQAKAILHDLCAHPGTAKSVAFKLARHMVADEPPQGLVSKLEVSFRTSGGDLTALYETLIDAPEAWEAEPRKVKTPDELLTSTSRLIGLNRTLAGDARDVFESFAQSPFTAPSPEGWPDTADAWIGPDSLNKRIEWAGRIAERFPTLDARQILIDGLGDLATGATRQAVARAESGSQALVLALMSPDFQRR